MARLWRLLYLAAAVYAVAFVVLFAYVLPRLLGL